MARIRSLKPDFFKDEDLATLPYEARLLFQGLWCLADREGRLEDRPKYLKAEIFPYDSVLVDNLLELLQNPKIEDRPEKSFIRRYKANNRKYIEIYEFLKHQSPHNTEKESEIPAFNGELTNASPLKNNGRPDDSESYPKPVNLNLTNKSELNKKEDQFEIFWKSYPKRKNKGQAEKSFKKVAPDEQLMERILTSIERAKKSEQWLKENGQFIPYPATWLSAKGWEDEEVEQHPLSGTVSNKTIRTVQMLDDWRPPV